MRCLQCHAINRPDAIVCFRCHRPLRRTPNPAGGIPVWLWQEKRDLLEQVRHRPERWTAWQIFFRRMVAAVLDQGFILLAYGLMTAPALWVAQYPLDQLRQQTPVQIQLGIIFALVHYLYTLVFQTFLSATPGYWTMGLVIVRAHAPAESLSLARVTARWALMVVLAVSGGVTVLWALIDTHHRFLHDRLVGTAPMAMEDYMTILDLSLKE